MNFLAYNSITGLYWNGSTFAGTIPAPGHAKSLTAVELAVLRYTYLNVAVLP